MEERIKFNISRSITRSLVYPMFKREDRVRKIKSHLSYFNNGRNTEMGLVQISPHLTQVMYFLFILFYNVLLTKY